MKTIIYLMGTDGSGKTTLSNNLFKKLKSEGKDVKYLYGRYRPMLVTPLKIISQLFIYKKNTEFKNYAKYSKIKTNFSKKHGFLLRIYAGICIVDYILFTWLHVIYKYLSADYIIVDRYVCDLVVTLSIASDLKENEIIFLINLFHKIFPFPTHTFFIDIDEDTAFQRKDDIQSVKFLKERNDKYFLFKTYYKFKILDGLRTKEQLLDDVYKRIQ